jgi:hypothetical protein
VNRGRLPLQEENPVRLRHVIGASALAALAAACSLGDSAESSNINVYLEVDKATLPVGESMNITATALNVGYTPLTLTGPSDCLIIIEVLTNSGQVTWSSNAGCMGGTVTETLEVSQSKAQTVTWSGVNIAGARLPAGFYHIRAIARVTGNAYVGPPLTVSLE